MPTITMSQTTTTRSATTSTMIFNTGYLKSVSGLLKLAQLVLGIICVGIVGYYISYRSAELYFLLMAVAFLIGTSCLLISCLVSLGTGGLISKTIYELVYHSVAFVLYFIAGVVLLVETVDGYYGNSHIFTGKYNSYMAASIIGIMNSILYLISIIFAHRAYNGI